MRTIENRNRYKMDIWIDEDREEHAEENTTLEDKVDLQKDNTAPLQEEITQICEQFPMLKCELGSYSTENHTVLALSELLPSQMEKESKYKFKTCAYTNKKDIHSTNNGLLKYSANHRKNSLNLRSSNPWIEADATSSKQNIFQNLMQYMQYMQYVKIMKLIGLYQDFNFAEQVQKLFLQSSCSNARLNSTKNIKRKYIPSKKQNRKFVNTNCYSEANNSGSEASYVEPLALIQSHCNDKEMKHDSFRDDFIISESKTIVSKPSTSVAPSFIAKGNEAFGGARKKEPISTVSSKKTRNAKKEYTCISLPQNFEKMYQSLILQYDEIDKDYIRQMCKDLSQLTHLCTTEKLEEIAKLRLQKKLLQLYFEPQPQEDGEEQYTYLSGIFPNADPTYLKKIVARAGNNPDQIEAFIQSQWDNPTYPTREEKLNRIRINDQQMQYTSQFNIKEFLRIFPDPYTYFKNQKRNCKFVPEAIEFLKNHFNHFEVITLNQVYEMYGFNLTNTVKKLERLDPTKKITRNYKWERCPPNNIPLLQECAFLVHKEEIKKYLAELKEAEDREFVELERTNNLLECLCCYDKCMPSKCSQCNDGHIFCKTCILEGTEVKIAAGDTRIMCFTNCSEEFSISTLQRILSPTQFSIFIRKKQEIEVMTAGLEGLVCCPFCHFASIPPPEDRIFKCFNPECMKESCRLCKEINHIPLKCYAERADKARLFLEEKMTEALVRNCYRCNKPYIKEDGCNKITCSCGATMCYICDQIDLSYDHFGESLKKCPLWSNNRDINIGTVREVAKKTIKYIQEKDPNVTINTKEILKGLPSINSAGIKTRVDKITRSAKI